MLNMLHRLAVALSDIAQFLNWRWLWNIGGALECWCDDNR